jgi:3-hexulose-6-phosphate synthase
MKLQISFDLIDLNKALEIATQTAQFADVLEIGAPLIYKEGIKAVQKFKEKFPDKTIFADVKVVDRVEEIITMFAKAGADYISILAGTSNSAIQKATQIAHSLKSKIALDLVDAYSMGQSAQDAKALDIDLIIFHGPYESTKLTDLVDEWQHVKGNTKIPIFVAGAIKRSNIDQIINLKPNGIIVGKAITEADNPTQEAEYFKNK